MDQGSYVIRPITHNDFDWLYNSSKIVGAGFTSIQSDQDYLRHRLDIVEKSFAQTIPKEQRIFLFVRENIPSGEIVGLCGIHAKIGYQDIFYNYQISTVSESSKELGIYLEHKILSLVTNFQHASELISFWIHPKYRGQNLSRTLSISRFLFIAQFPDWFGDEIIAEIRGVSDDDGNSPFWEAIGRHFFAMDFKRADSLTLTIGKQYISDLMAHEPIYLDLLSAEAQKVVGVEHTTAGTARYVLESEGFRFNNYIDIFDGGPLLNVPRDKIKTVVNSRTATLIKCVDDLENGVEAMLYNARADVRMTAAEAKITENNDIIVTNSTAKILNIRPGEKIRYCLL